MKLDRSLPTIAVCPQCGNTFAYRSNKKFCSRNCKKRHGEAVLIQERKGRDSTLRVRRYIERRATQDWIYQQVFSTEPRHRADVLLAFLIFAATTNTKSYIDLFTYPTAQRSSRFTAKEKGTLGLHYRGNPSLYPTTLAAMANNVCKHHLGITSRQFIDEIRRDGVTMADMQSVYDELMDTTKATPVVQGCDPESRDRKPLPPGFTGVVLSVLGQGYEITRPDPEREDPQMQRAIQARGTPKKGPGTCNE